MTIDKKQDGNTLTLSLAGRLDTMTAPALDAEIQAIPADTLKLILDFSAVDYVSSAGLRVLLTAQKKMNAAGGGSMVLTGVRDAVMEVFEVTGFSGMLTIE